VGSEQDVAPTIYGMYKLLITYYPIIFLYPYRSTGTVST